jgi:hypothetical protein
MKDFAEKQTAEHVRLISGQGFLKLLFLELAENSFTLIPGLKLTKWIKNLRFSTRKKVMKDFAEKQTAENVRLISGQGF